MGCSSTKTESVKKVEVENKSIFFTGNFNIINTSFKEDVSILTSEYIDGLSKLMKEDLDSLFKSYGYHTTEIKDKVLSLNIIKTDLKEFKIHVNGPSVNVATIRLDYQIIKDGVIKESYEEINKESLDPFTDIVFQNMCNQAINNLVKKIVEE